MQNNVKKCYYTLLFLCIRYDIIFSYDTTILNEEQNVIFRKVDFSFTPVRTQGVNCIFFRLQMHFQGENLDD